MRPWIGSLSGLLVSLLVGLSAAPAASQCPEVPFRTQVSSHTRVEEVSHVVEVQLTPHRALLESSFSLRTRSPRTAEVHYSLPPSIGVESFRLCSEERCTDSARLPGEALQAYRIALAAPGREGQPVAPIGALASRHRFRNAQTLRMAPLSSASPLDVVVRSVMPTELHGGTVSVYVDLTGFGPETTLRVSAPGLEDVRIEGAARSELTRRPGGKVRLSARLPEGPPITRTFESLCDGRRCTRRSTRSPWAGSPRDLVLVLDASDSMVDVTHAGVQRTIEALRRALPDGSTIRVVAFGRRLETPVPEPAEPDSVDPVDLAGLRLGNRSEAQDVWPIVERWAAESTRSSVVVVTDGRLALQPPEGLALSIVEVWAGDYGRAPVTASGPLARAHGGAHVSLGEVIRREPYEPLDDHLRELFASTLSPRFQVEGERPLRAGEERTATVGARGRSERPSTSRLVALAPGAREAAALWRQAGRASYPLIPGAIEVDHSLSQIYWPGPCEGTSPRDRHRACGRRRMRVPRIRACCVQVRGSVAREAIARAMDAARPAVAACFASARRGRLDWNARFMYRLIIANREIVAAQIASRTATVDDEMVGCLLDRPLANLHFPGADGGGAIAINYPFATLPHIPQPDVTLDPGIETELEDIVGDEPADGSDL